MATEKIKDYFRIEPFRSFFQCVTNFFHKVSVVLAALYRALQGSLLVPVYVRSIQAVLCEHLAGRDFKEDVYVVELCITEGCLSLVISESGFLI